MMKRRLFTGMLALGICSFAFASGDTFVAPATTSYFPGVYLGVQGGYGLTGWDNVQNAIGGKFGTVSKENAAAGRAYIGYDFHPNFAIEAGYTQFFNDTKIKDLILNKTRNPKYDYVVDVVGKLKAMIMGNFGLYAKAGVDFMATNEGLDGKKHNAFNVVYGAGGFYEITPSFAVDLAWTRFNGNAEWSNDYIPSADLFTLGASYKFNLS